MPSTDVRLDHLWGRQVSVALTGGRRIDDAQLVSVGRRTLWLVSNREDVFVPRREVLDCWEVAALR